jgi:hypothetical protein
MEAEGVLSTQRTQFLANHILEPSQSGVARRVHFRILIQPRRIQSHWDARDFLGSLNAHDGDVHQKKVNYTFVFLIITGLPLLPRRMSAGEEGKVGRKWATRVCERGGPEV